MRRGGTVIRTESGHSRRLFLGLGANLGDRARQLAVGLEMLANKGVTPVRIAPIYETEPVGMRQQPNFLNLVAEVETTLSTREVMEVALGVERRAGRVRREPGGPRTLDVDLLLDGDLVLAEEGLEVPHPRLHLRRFVLVPLADLAPGLVHPVTGKTVAALLTECPDSTGLWPYARRLQSPLACGFRDGRSIMGTSP